MSPSTGSGSTSHTGVVHLKRIWKLFYLAIRGYKGLSRSKSRINRGLSLVVLGVIAFLSILGGFQVANPQILTDWIHLKFTLKDMGFSGMLSYIAMVSILPLFSPLTLVIITGSAIFGPVKGFFLSYIGCIINANIAYILVKALSIETPWSNSSRTVWSSHCDRPSIGKHNSVYPDHRSGHRSRNVMEETNKGKQYRGLSRHPVLLFYGG